MDAPANDNADNSAKESNRPDTPADDNANRGKASERPDAPSDNYDDHTVKEAKAAVRAGELDPAAALAYERANKDRVTLTRFLEDRLPEINDAGGEADGYKSVPVASTRTGLIAGILFETAHETRVLERTPRVEEAISKGDLRELDYEP